MNRIIAWFATNGVAANLLMLLIVGAGILGLPRIKREVFPEFPLDMIEIRVEYRGATPVEVEEGVCVRIEEEIQGLDGIKRLTSQAMEGVGVVRVELLRGADRRKVLDDVKARVDAIDTFPEETEKPVITEMVNRHQVIDVAVSGDTDEATLKRLGERVRDDILALPGITLAHLAAARPYEISIEVSEEALRRYQLSFDEVAAAVRRGSLDLPAGSIRTRGGEILLRTLGQAYRRPDFERLALRVLPDGSRLRLGDVATVVDGFAETDESARFDGRRAVLVQVFRVGPQSALEVADAVKRYVHEAQMRMPPGIHLDTWSDRSVVLRSRMDLLMRNGRAGFVLVFLVLALFLRFRLAVWVTIGIPISFLGALALMPSLDVSINLVSLFAFIVVLGIVVDDAIVVGENVFSHQRRGKPPLQAAIAGAQEVSTPVIFAVLTTVAAFAPLVVVEGNIGKVMRVIPLIVIPTLLFSLVESLFVLPNHLSHERAADGGRHLAFVRAWHAMQDRFARGLERFVDRTYRRHLDVGLRWRYLTVAGGLAALLLTTGLIAGGRLHFNFFPAVEADYVAAMLTMPLGTPVETTDAAVRRIESAAEHLRDELARGSQSGTAPIRSMVAAVGNQPYRTAQSQNGGGRAQQFAGAHVGEVTLALAPAEDRDISSQQIADRWRELTGPIPDALELQFTSSLFSAGEDIHVRLRGLDLDALRATADTLKQVLATYPGVHEIADNFRAGKREIQLTLEPRAEVLGITLADLARQVRQAFYGEEAQRIQRGRDDVRVMVRYPASARRSLAALDGLRIRTPAGNEVPFHEVARAHLGRGTSTIQRTDRMRSIDVTASVDASRNDTNVILADLGERVLPALLAPHPDLSWSFEGQAQQQRETMGGLLRGFVLALLVIYALMAIPFRSYVQPLLVMSAIPFGLIGAVWGHVVLGMHLTIMSMFGVVALTGVVVNDSLVLVDYINRRRREGMALDEAVRLAGRQRFRPILLTSLTTFFGLTPLLLEKSMQARFLIPMAASLAFGVLFATFVTLLLVPAGYLILEDLRRLLGLRTTMTAPDGADDVALGTRS